MELDRRRYMARGVDAEVGLDLNIICEINVGKYGGPTIRATRRNDNQFLQARRSSRVVERSRTLIFKMKKI